MASINCFPPMSRHRSSPTVDVWLCAMGVGLPLLSQNDRCFMLGEPHSMPSCRLWPGERIPILPQVGHIMGWPSWFSLADTFFSLFFFSPPFSFSLPLWSLFLFFLLPHFCPRSTMGPRELWSHATHSVLSFLLMLSLLIFTILYLSGITITICTLQVRKGGPHWLRNVLRATQPVRVRVRAFSCQGSFSEPKAYHVSGEAG